MPRKTALILLCAALAGCQDVQAPENAIPAGLQPITAAAPAPRFIVTVREGESPLAVARDHGVVPTVVFERVATGFAGRMGDAARSGLLKDGRVQRVERDLDIRADDVQAAASWGLDRVDQRALPLSGTYSFDANGAGVTVYIVDTGIRYTHSDFGGRAGFGFDLFGGNGADCYGHGTHVAGIVSGTKYGVAKGAALVSVRVIDCDGAGTISGVVAGLDWIAMHGKRPAVANLSMSSGASTAFDDAIRRLHQAGVVTAVSAGNSDADACKQSPARVREAMTVGASDANDLRASFSNHGSCIDWFAPGVSIVSTCHGSDLASCTRSGTSVAAPHTAGAAALFLQRNPGATPQQVHDGLLAQSSKGLIGQARSANNHLLFTLGDTDDTPVARENAPPLAMYGTTCVHLDCSFSDLSGDADGSVVAWRWDFGDGTTSAERHPKHSFPGTGIYDVRLTVTDDGGLSASASEPIAVEAAPRIGLEAKAVKVRGVTSVTLSWTGAETSTVDIIRNNVTYASVTGVDRFVDVLGKGKVPAYPYRVCEVGTGVCSRVVYPSY